MQARHKGPHFAGAELPGRERGRLRPPVWLRLAAWLTRAQIGKNYAKHKVEMGGTAERLEKPMFFFKPNSSVIASGEPIVRPAGCKELHHEVELGVVIKGRARNVSAADWRSVLGGWVLGLDMTARDWQLEAKKAGAPWSLSKGCDSFTPLTTVLPADAIADPAAMTLRLRVDGKERQFGSTSAMLHSVPELIAYVTSVITLEDGDVILTGTPEGVAEVAPGSVISCELADEAGTVAATLECPVVDGGSSA